jgi:DNA-binding transcriptional regulator YiaG
MKMSGNQLQEIRKNTLRLKQEQFGRILGVHSTTVSDWEREGKSKSVPGYAALVATLMADDPMLREKVIKMAGV